MKVKTKMILSMVLFRVVKALVLIALNICIAFLLLRLAFPITFGTVVVLWFVGWLFGIIKPLGMFERLLRRQK